MTIFSNIRLQSAALVTVLALALAGCFMSPGKFTSELAITGADSFTFSYEGEIFFLGLSKLAQMGAAMEESFAPAECYDDETYETRDCTEEELAQQRTDWDADAAARAAKAKKDAEAMKAIMGGIDPSDPKAAEELVRLLQRQKGWKSVVHKGDGVFAVSFAASGTMGHDFMFPMIEGFPPINPFVQMFLRNGGQARINAPGFSVQNADNPLAGMAGGMGALAGLAALGAETDNAEGDSEAPKEIPGVPLMEGTFTIRTAPGMRILANNTDEGTEAASGGGEVLRWTISPRTSQAPTALIATGG